MKESSEQGCTRDLGAIGIGEEETAQVEGMEVKGS